MAPTAVVAQARDSLRERGTTPTGPRDSNPAVVRAVVDSLASKLDAILVTGDLQGLEAGDSARRAPRALGEVLAQEMAELGEHGPVPGAQRTGVILTERALFRPERAKPGSGGLCHRASRTSNASLTWRLRFSSWYEPPCGWRLDCDAS